MYQAQTDSLKQSHDAELARQEAAMKQLTQQIEKLSADLEQAAESKHTLQLEKAACEKHLLREQQSL